MQAAEVNKIMVCLIEKRNRLRLNWKDSRFEKLKDEKPLERDHLATKLLFNLLTGEANDVYLDGNNFCILKSNMKNGFSEFKFWAKTAVIDDFGSFSFRGIDPIGYTHLFLLGVLPNELRYEIVANSEIGDYDLKLMLNDFKIDINSDKMHSFDSFESDLVRLIKKPATPIYKS